VEKVQHTAADLSSMGCDTRRSRRACSTPLLPTQMNKQHLSHMLHLEKDVTAPKTLFPQQSHFISHSDDFSEKKFIAPIYRYIINKIDTLNY